MKNKILNYLILKIETEKIKAENERKLLDFLFSENNVLENNKQTKQKIVPTKTQEADTDEDTIRELLDLAGEL